MVLFVLFAAMARGQTLGSEVFGAGSIWAMGMDGSVAGTIGEIFTETLDGGNYILFQGFHQPYGQVFGIGELMDDIRMSVYPCPAHESLNICFDGEIPDERFFISLTDMQGRCIFREEIKKGISRIDVSGISPGLYLVSLSMDGLVCCNIKISKY